MALLDFAELAWQRSPGGQITAVTIVLTGLCLASTLWRLFNPRDSLNRVPGPILCRLTELPLIYHSYLGDEAQYVHSLHLRYGPIVRIGPRSVDFTEVAALKAIYLTKGGFVKARYYHNFDVDGHASIFSQPNMTERAPRAKVILPLFSTASVNAASPIFEASRQRFLARFKELKNSCGGEILNVLDLARAMSIDAVTEYLFGIRYGALEDETSGLATESTPGKAKATKRGTKMIGDFKLSASAVVDNFVSTSRFWYLPGWLYNVADQIDLFLNPNPTIDVSTNVLNEYSNRVIRLAETRSGKDPSGASPLADKKTFMSFPARLLRAGFSASETRSQCKDIIYAATDTIGMNLSTVCFMLAKHPKIYDRLYEEVSTAVITKSEDIQQLTYLTCVIREALRLAMTNPCRLPREVPASGWTYKDVAYPPGAVVSCSAYEMHFSEDIYQDADQFRPERWLNPSEDANTCMMAFGMGNRQCIAKGLSMLELHHITYLIVKEELLRGARPLKDKIEIVEGFTSKVIGSRVDLTWN